MKLATVFALVWCIASYCGCGGAEFTSIDGAGDAGASAVPGDAPSLISRAELSDGADESSKSSGVEAALPSQDAGDERISRIYLDSSAPAADAKPEAGSAEPDAGPPPPPPALCCATPCGGTSPAAITCGNGAAWTCAAGSCSDRACDVGTVCTWMGSCTGRVEVCP